MGKLDDAPTRHSPASPHDTSIAVSSGHQAPSSSLPLTVRVTLRTGVLVLLTTVALASIVTFVVFFANGLELFRFESTTKSSSHQSQLLDQYNSYSGTLATLFGTPIEVFVTVSVQVIVLRLVTLSLLRADASWKTGALATAAAAGVQFLISNGFNALNVQLHKLELHPILSQVDLSVISNVSTLQTSNVTRTISETSPGNPLTNTLLRNVVLPSVASQETQCSWQSTEFQSGKVPVPRTLLEIGFPQHDWQAKLLQRARVPQTLRVIVNPTNKTVNDHVQSKNLPMDASRAADLFLYGMSLAEYFVPWGNQTSFVNASDILARYPPRATDNSQSRTLGSIVTGLLPPPANDEDEDEQQQKQQRDWFMKASSAALRRFFKSVANTSQSDLVMEFSHVQLSPSIQFDAVTFEAEMDPSLMATTTGDDKSTRYTEVAQWEQCNPSSPAQCVFKKAKYSVEDADDFDAAPQVHTLAMCADANGVEKLEAYVRYDEQGGFALECNQPSQTSLLVVSIAKKLVAENLQQNVTVSKPQSLGQLKPDRGAVTLTNLRKFFSITIGRLGWESENLATKFHATCDSNARGCDGLFVPLEPPLTSSSLSSSSSSSSSKEYLVVGTDALPLKQLAVPKFVSKPRFLPLVFVHEPPMRQEATPHYNAVVGDLLLPHNIGHVSWDWNQRLLDPADCDAKLEDRITRILNNHLYMEHGLQPAYTAAMFFLFQNAVVKTSVPLLLREKETLFTLDFAKNSQEIAVFMSIPRANAWLTLAGCLVLLVGLVAVVLKTFSFTHRRQKDQDPLREITEPSAIARVLLDGGQFPSLLLRRDVVDFAEKDQSYSARPVEGFVIQSLSLKNTTEEDARQRSPTEGKTCQSL